MQYAYIKLIQQLGLDVRSWFSREGGNDPGSLWTMGYGPIFPSLLGKGTGVHWGFVGLPTRESTTADGTVAHFS